MHNRMLFSAMVAVVSSVGCSTSPVAPPTQAGSCRYGQTAMPAVDVPPCLVSLHILSDDEARTATAVLTRVSAERDSLSTDTGSANFWRAAERTRALQHIVDFYSQGLFEDSARFHRMMDQVKVTEEYVNGTLMWTGPYAWPVTTPYLSWTYYQNLGVYFQPVNTVQSVASLFARSTVPTDSLTNMGEQLYAYALWRTRDGHTFPVWEYDFPWNSGGVAVQAPWISGMAQGYAIILFTENYRRTGDPVWRDRAFASLESFRVSWNDGGVLLPDTTHGYWWEEYHPSVMVWNGAAQAVLAVGELWSATNDPEVKRMFDSGIAALKYYTPEFDTGYWTLYSRTQWYNTIAYHQSCIRIMDALYTVSSDPYFSTVADRWRQYVPPPGVQ